MEFPQENRYISAKNAILDTVAEQLTDVDLTLPDYCPDIEKILKCTLTPKIQTQSLSGGQLQVDGVCVVNVLYVESIKKTIRSCEQSVGFSQNFSVKDASDTPVIITDTKPEYINCRALSPRRLVMHGAFSLYAKVFTTEKIPLYSPADKSLETLKTAVQTADIRSLCQEQFNVCEDISLANKPAVESILNTDVKISVTDVKSVTGKLMLNGELNLKMLYLANLESGETEKLDYILPFNRIIDCEGVDEETVNCVNCSLLSYDIHLKNDMLSEKPIVTVDAKICVTEEGYAVREQELISDAYSIESACVPEFQQLTITNLSEQLAENHLQKLSVTVDNEKISKILDIFIDSVTCESKSSDLGISVTGKLNICILAVNGDGQPIFVERSGEYEHSFSNENELNTLDSVSVYPSSISYRLADDSTVEIRCELKLSVCAMKNTRYNAVKQIEVLEDRPVPAESCALTLYYAKSGESLWNIAKSHHTRLDMLLSENNEESIILDSPRMLLIPRI